MPTPVVQIIAATLCAVLPLQNSFASDNDTPPYLIYIDPSTGKYTTQDPSAPVTNPHPVTDDNKSAVQPEPVKTVTGNPPAVTGGAETDTRNQ